MRKCRRRRTKANRCKRHRANPKRWTLAAIAHRNRKAGGHFFDRPTMKFFREKMSHFKVVVAPTGAIFVTRRADGKIWPFDPKTGRIKPAQGRIALNPLHRRGSQTREPLRESGYRLYKRLNRSEVILQKKDAPGKLELWVRRDDFSGYVIVIGGKGYEFVRSGSAGDLIGRNPRGLPASVGFGATCGAPKQHGRWLLEVERTKGRLIGYATESGSARTYGVFLTSGGDLVSPKTIGGAYALPQAIRTALAKRLRACGGRRGHR